MKMSNCPCPADGH